MIDEQGYRPNVCIVIANSAGQVFWGKRRQQSAWQFPQGGIEAGESIEAALYRELQEETGLVAEQVQLIAVTKPWYRYRLPKHMLKNNQSNYVGQKQKYGLLKILDDAHQFVLDQDRHPEFEDRKSVGSLLVSRWRGLGAKARCLSAGVKRTRAFSKAMPTRG